MITFDSPNEEGVLKTFWEKEKILVTCIFFFICPEWFLLFERQM